MAKNEEATLTLKIKTAGEGALRGISAAMGGLRSAITAAATALATYAVAVVAFAKHSAEFEEVNSAFNRMAAAQGQDADAMLSKLKELTQGTVSSFDLIKAANTAMLQGIRASDIPEFFAQARRAAQDTGRSFEEVTNILIKGISKQSQTMLQSAGIAIDVKGAMEAYAASVHKSASELSEAEQRTAVMNAALAQVRENAAAAGPATLSLADRFEQIKASFSDTSLVIGSKLGPAFEYLLDKSQATLAGIQEWAKGNAASQVFEVLTETISVVINSVQTLGEVIGTVFGGLGEILTAVITGNFQGIKDAVTSFFDVMSQDISNGVTRGQTDWTNIEKRFADQRLASTKTEHAQKKGAYTVANSEEKAALTTMQQFKKDINSQQIQDYQATFQKISTLQNAHNKGLVVIGKAAAAADITISTAQGVAKAWALGPIVGPFLAGLVVAAGAAQLAQERGDRMRP